MYERSYESPSSLVTVLVAICVIVFGFLCNATYDSGYGGVILIPITVLFLIVDFIVNMILVIITWRKKNHKRDEGWLFLLPPLTPFACGLFFITIIT